MAKLTDTVKDTSKKLFSSFVNFFRKEEKDTLDKNSSPTDLLKGIHKLLIEIDVQKKIDAKNDRKADKNEEREEERRHKAILKALTVRRKKPKPKAEPLKKKKEKVKPEEKPEKVTKPKAEPAPKAEPPKPKVEKAEVPKPKAEPAKPRISKGVSTAAKIAVGAGGVFAGAEAFAATMYPYAKMASDKLGGKIPPEAILGQWAGESSSGKSLPANFNYAGIKAGPNDKKGDYVLTEERYTPQQIKQAQAKGETLERVLGPTDTITKKGKQVTVDEWFGKGSIQKAASEGKQWVQVRSYFAKFDNAEEFTNRYVQILSNDRYKKARESTTPEQFGLEVAKAGYATASSQKYSEHVGSYVRQNTELLNTLSKENADVKKEIQESNIVTNQVTNNIVGSNASTPSTPSAVADDRNPHERKKAE